MQTTRTPWAAVQIEAQAFIGAAICILAILPQARSPKALSTACKRLMTSTSVAPGLIGCIKQVHRFRCLDAAGLLQRASYS
jgi:hypothetical protein